MNLNSKTNMCWNETNNFEEGEWAFLNSLNTICGENVFGKGKSKSEIAKINVMKYLERSMGIDSLKNILPGDIISEPPTYEFLVARLIDLCERSPSYYNKFPKTHVTDTWSCKVKSIKEGMPLNINDGNHKRLIKYGGKRFTGEKLSIKENLIDMVKNSRDTLAEGFVVSFLNSGLKCPECKVVGKIGWCKGMDLYCSESFRDAICMNCYKKNKITLFEIKIRWEEYICDKNNTYSGSFIALNVLFAMRVNVYLVIVSRDTGNVRIGKITKTKMRGNKNWLYSLQENVGWGGPSSVSICKNGLHKLPVKMKKPLVEILTQGFCNKIYNEVISTFIKCEHCDSKDIKFYNSNFSSNMSKLCKDCAKRECCVLCGFESGGGVCSSCSCM